MQEDQTFPYNRFVQWAAGPVSIGAGLACAYLGTKIGLVRSHQAEAVHDLTALGMTSVGAGVTYAAHHKWLGNVAHYLFAQEAAGATIAASTGDTAEGDEPADVEGATDVEATAPMPAVTADTVAGPPPIAPDAPPAPPASS